MKHDPVSMNALMMRAQVLRRRCVEAHNRLQNDSGRSVLAEVIRSLPVRVKFDGECAEHRLLSCYAFWGHREIGGERRRFNRRLERSSPAPIQVLHRHVGEASFGAWECEGVAGEGSVTWRPVGLDAQASVTAWLVTDVDGERAEVNRGDVRVGWMLEEDGKPVLLFSMALADAAADRLRKTANEQGWDAPEDGEGGGFRQVEYERDLLVQAVRPDCAQCGLDPFYFLPLDQRTSFPGRFARALLDELVRRYSREGTPWHVTFAKATSEASIETLRLRFDSAREQAARSAGRYRGGMVKAKYLPRLASDEDIFAAFGLGPDGEVDLDAFLPLKMHPLEYLDLDEGWFEAVGVSPKTPIHEALAHVEQSGADEHSRRLEEAIEAHRIRLRWVALMRHAVGDERVNQEEPGLLEIERWRLEPGYDELYEAAEEVFGPAILDRRLAEIFAEDGRLTKRVEAALVDAGEAEPPPCVRDLPATKYSLKLIRGIGPTSQEAITEFLREAMIGWADELARPSGDSDGQAAEGIESGLDELDALFG